MEKILFMKKIGIVIWIFILGISCKEKSNKPAPDKNQAKPATQQTKSPPQKAIKQVYVATEGGLFLRDKPSIEGKKITLMKPYSELDVLEEADQTITIQNANGKWLRVRYLDQEGWAFGGFLLTSEELAEKDKDLRSYLYNFKKGPKREQLSTIIEEYNQYISSDNATQIAKIQQLENRLEKIEITENDYKPGANISYLGYDKEGLIYNMCSARTQKQHCTRLGPLKYYPTQQALVKMIQKAIQEKNPQPLIEASPCIISIGCYACDGGPMDAIASQLFARLVNSKQISTKIEKPEYEGFPYRFGKIEIMLHKYEEKGWYISIIPMSELVKPVCTGPGV